MIPRASDVAASLSSSRRALRSAPTKILFSYCIAGLVWILATNAIIAAFALPDASYTLRGLLLILLTGTGIWLFNRRLASDVMHAQSLLSDAEHGYRALFESHPAPMVLYDRQSLRIVKANEAAARLYDHGQDVLAGMTLLDLHAPQERRELENSPGGPVDAEWLAGTHRHLDSAGRLLDVRVSCQDSRAEDEPWGLLMVQDLGEHLGIETRLAQSLRQLELAQQVAVMGHWEYHLRSASVQWSPEIFSILGIAPDAELDVRSYRSHIHPDDRAQVRQAHRQAIAEGQLTHEYSVLCRDGRRRYLFERMQITTEAGGRRRTLFGVFMDVTELKEAQGGLAEQKLRYERMVQSLPDGVLLVRHGIIQFANAAARRMLESDPSRPLEGCAFATTVHPDFRSREVDRLEAIQNGLTVEQPPRGIKLMRGDGSAFEAQVAEIPLGASGHREVQLLIHDVSHSEQMRRELEQANQRLQQLSQRLIEVQEMERRQLALDLHDDLGQQLTALKLQLQRLSGKLDVQSETGELAQALSVQVDEALAKIRTLSLALHPLQLETLGLEAAMRWHLQNFLANSEATWSLEVQGELGQVPPSRAVAVFRVMQEAVNNIMRHAGASAVRIMLSGQADELRLEILDDGSGFDLPAAAGQARSLGLTSMSERVASQGGELKISSLKGVGTRITAILPVSLATIEE